jgi:hypothetical protein
MLTISRFIFLSLIVVIVCGTAFGDGKIFIGEGVPADIPYQRAFIIFNENTEALILQSKYELSQSASVDSLGWVVPVPSVPEITSVDADIAHWFFFHSARHAGPKIHYISQYFFLIILLIFITSLAFLGLCIIQRPFLNRWHLSKELWNSRFKNSLIITSLFFFVTLFTTPHLGLSIGVEVVEAEKAGIYDIKVIKSESAEAIINWLKENAFTFNEKDMHAFEDYINRKWCFVVAKVQPETGTEEEKITYGRMVAPLILKFETEKAVYPLALTSTIGKETEILLYILSHNKLDCNKRLKLRYADKSQLDDLISNLLSNAEQEINDFFEGLPQPMIFCKFKGKLTPEQMKTDIVFESAPDNKPYRETKVLW